MPDATNGEDDGDSFSYYVTATLSQVESFYSTQMPPLGWTFVSRDDSIEGMLYLFYEKDSVAAAVGALQESDRCYVVITTS
jgi:hypothetical protein